MKPLVINDEAADELEESVRHYEKKSSGIGLSLAARVSEAFRRTAIRSSIHFIATRMFKNALSEGFLTTCSYIEIDERRVVLAVAHQKLRPDYWKFRTRRSEWDVGRIRGIR